VNYLKPVPLNQPLRVESREVKVKGRKHINMAEILNGKGEVLARSEGLFIAIDPKRMFASTWTGEDRSVRDATKVTLTETLKYRIPIFIMTKRIRSKIARGSAEIAILALLAEQPLYGFEISRQIEARTGGVLHFTLCFALPNALRP